MTTVITPFMSMSVPVPSATPGPEWAQDITASLFVVDAHDHSPGHGAPLSLSSSVSFQSVSASVGQFTSLTAATATIGSFIADQSTTGSVSASFGFSAFGLGSAGLGWANVRDPQYAGGAKGDGITDDTAAITAAIASRLQVYLPSGTYLVSNLTCSLSATSFLGAGRNLTILSSSAGTTLNVSGNFQTGVFENIPNISIKGMTIKNSSTASGTYALRLERVSRFDLEDVITSGGGTGLYLHGALVGSAKNCEFKSATTGVFGENHTMSPLFNSNNVEFYSCLFTACGDGIQTGVNCNNWKFYGGDVEANTTNGYRNLGTNELIEFYGTWFENEVVGIQLDGEVRGLVVYGCNFALLSSAAFSASVASSNISVRSCAADTVTFNFTNCNGEFLKNYINAVTLVFPSQNFTTDASATLGSTTAFGQYRWGGAVNDFAINGSPEGNVVAGPGSIARSSSGVVYFKGTGTGSLGWQAAGGSGTIDSPGIVNTSGSSSIALKGAAADGATAIGVILDNTNNLTVQGALVTSFRRSGTQVASIDKGGSFSGANISSSTGLFTTTDAASGTATIRGTAADGASAIGVIIDNTVNLAAVGALALSIRRGGIQIASVDKGGAWSSAVVTGTTVTGTTGLFGVLGQGVVNISGSAGPGAVIQSFDTNTGLTFQTNKNGNSVGSDITYNSVASRTAGNLLLIQNSGSEKAHIDFAGNTHISGVLSCSYSQNTTVTGSVTLNAPTGRFVIATGTTSFVLTNSAILAQSILYVNIETSSSANPIKSVTPTLGTGTIALASSSVNLTASFIVFNGA